MFTKSTTSAADKKGFFISMIILAVMFFIFGLVSWVNSILIPYFKIACELTHFQSYFVTFAFYIAYFVMAIPSGLLLKKVGFKKGILYGFILMALGAFIFVPAAMTRLYGLFLIGLYSIGTGSSLLVMGLIGNGIFPLIYGAFADAFNLRLGYWVLIPCFAYLVWFAFYGYKINYWRKSKEEIAIIRK